MTGTAGPQLVGPSDDEVEDRAADAAPGTAVQRRTGPRLVLGSAVALVLVQLLLRGWMVGQRGLYGDDLHYGTLAMHLPLLSTDLLFANHGGHFMPGALLLDGILTRIAPLEWWPLATALLVLQALASLAVLRVLRVLLGSRPALLVPLTLYLFSPLNLGFFAWWSAAMNSLPLQIGLAWVVADAVLLLRTGRVRYAVSATVVFLLTLSCYERAVLIPLFAFALVALLLHVDGTATPLRAAWQRCRPLWVAAGLVLVGWAWAFTTAIPSGALDSATVGQVVATVKSAVRSPLPGLLGGPWSWSSGPPDTPHADAPPALTLLSLVVLATVVGWTVRRLRGAARLWAIAATYVLVGAGLVALGRGAFGTNVLLPLTYRYVAAEVVVLTIVVAVLFTLPARDVEATLPAAWADRAAGRLARPVPAAVLTAGFVVSALVSTVSYLHLWSENRTPDYIATARAALAANANGSPLLDQAVPEDVLNGLFYPSNTVSELFGPATPRPEFAEATDDPRLLDDSGHLVPARVAQGLPLVTGTVPGCGWSVSGDSGTALPLDGELFDWVWTARLEYVASRDGVITAAMSAGGTVRAPVRAGAHTVYLRLVGSGGSVQVTNQTFGSDLCISSGRVGNLVEK